MTKDLNDHQAGVMHCYQGDLDHQLLIGRDLNLDQWEAGDLKLTAGEQAANSRTTSPDYLVWIIM